MIIPVAYQWRQQTSAVVACTASDEHATLQRMVATMAEACASDGDGPKRKTMGGSLCLSGLRAAAQVQAARGEKVGHWYAYARLDQDV